MPESTDFTVYQNWPETTIKDALADFKKEMYEGADVAELQAGLRCLDFLCTRSVLSRALQDDVEYTTLQANMRIELLLSQPSEEAPLRESHERAVAGVEQLQRMVRAFKDRFTGGRNIGYPTDCVYDAVRDRVRQRLQVRV